MKTSPTRAHRRALLALALALAGAGCATVSGLDSLSEGTSDGGSTDDASVGSTYDGGTSSSNNGNDSGSSSSSMDAGPGASGEGGLDAGQDAGPSIQVIDIFCQKQLCGFDGGASGDTFCCWDRGSNNNSVCELVDGGPACKNSNGKTQLYCDSKDDCVGSPTTPFCCLDEQNGIGKCGTETTCRNAVNGFRTLCRTFADCPEGGALAYTQCAPSGGAGNLLICK